MVLACAAEPRAAVETEAVAGLVDLAADSSQAAGSAPTQEWPRWGNQENAPTTLAQPRAGRKFSVIVLGAPGPAPSPQVIPNPFSLPPRWRKGMGESMVRDAVFWHGFDVLVVRPAHGDYLEMDPPDFCSVPSATIVEVE
jgi:hypothetical protein